MSGNTLLWREPNLVVVRTTILGIADGGFNFLLWYEFETRTLCALPYLYLPMMSVGTLRNVVGVFD